MFVYEWTQITHSGIFGHMPLINNYGKALDNRAGRKTVRAGRSAAINMPSWNTASVFHQKSSPIEKFAGCLENNDQSNLECINLLLGSFQGACLLFPMSNLLWIAFGRLLATLLNCFAYCMLYCLHWSLNRTNSICVNSFDSTIVSKYAD